MGHKLRKEIDMNSYQQRNLDLDEYEHTSGLTCERCGRGTYGEQSMYNDWDGTETCDFCWFTVKHLRRVGDRPDFMPEQVEKFGEVQAKINKEIGR